MKLQALLAILMAGAMTAHVGCGRDDGPVCGDGHLDESEQCDDGNQTAIDGCSPDCAIEVELCTDGIDNDGDSAIDCDDSECAASTLCEGVCDNPFAVADPTTVQGDTSERMDFSVSSCQEMFGGTGGGDVVFEVTPMNEILQLRLQSDSDQGIAVRTTCDDAPSEVACADMLEGGADEIVVTRVTPGEPVSVIVGAFDAAGEGPFSLDIVSRPVQCNDGIIDRPDEQCDDGNNDPGDGCDETCQFEQICGDGYVAHLDFGGNETCDDGNTDPGDGCDDMCLAEVTPEIEPNEDGTPETGGMEAEGNDFSAAGAQGPFTESFAIVGSLSPAGDEDVFAIENVSPYYESLRLDTYRQGRGLGQPCLELLDTSLAIRDETGLWLRGNDDRLGSADRCSGLFFLMAPGQTIYAHVIHWGDNVESDPYFLAVGMATCGDGIVENLEVCDDGNNTPGDGCDENCGQ